MPDLAFAIDIDLDRFEPEFGDERLDGLVAAAVFRYCKRRDPLAEPRLQPLERGHLAQARLAPSGPKVDEDELASKVRQIEAVSGAVGKRDRRRRERLRGGQELAEFGAVGCVGLVLGRRGGTR